MISLRHKEEYYQRVDLISLSTGFGIKVLKYYIVMNENIDSQPVLFLSVVALIYAMKGLTCTLFSFVLKLSSFVLFIKKNYLTPGGKVYL